MTSKLHHYLQWHMEWSGQSICEWLDWLLGREYVVHLMTDASPVKMQA